MAFDVAGARQAGYSESDIAQFLAQERGFNFGAARQSGYSDSDILSFLTSGQGQSPEVPAIPERSLLGAVGARVGDVAGSLVSGGGGLLTGAGGLAGMAGAGYDNPLTRAGRSVQEYGEGLMSPELVQKRQLLERALREAEGQGFRAEAAAAIGTLASNPGLLASMAIEQIPQFLGSFGIGRGAMLAGQAAGRVGSRAAVVGAERAGIEAGERAGMAASIGSAAGLQGGEVANQTYQDVMGLSPEVLQSSPEFQALSQQIGPDAARERLANEAARLAGVLAGGVSVASMSLLPSAERSLFASNLSRQAISRALRVGAGEAAGEFVEEGGGRLAQNIGAQSADTQRDLSRGVVGAATTGAVLGGVMGAGAGALSRPGTEPQIEREDLREAIGQVVGARGQEGVQGPALISEDARYQLPSSDLTRSQAERYMERAAERYPELPSIPGGFEGQFSYLQDRLRADNERMMAARRGDNLPPVAPVQVAAAQPEAVPAPTLLDRIEGRSEEIAPLAPSGPQATSFNVPLGVPFPVQTPDGSMTIETVPEIVDLGSLEFASGRKQNRMMENPANQAMISSISGAPDFRRLTTSPYSDRGAPIVGPDNMIEVGNHRVAGLKKAAQENPEGFGQYVRSLQEAGYDTAGVKFPVLVRRRITNLNEGQRVEFTRLSNTESNQSLSATEKASEDAMRLTPEMLNKYDGDVSGGLRAAKNRPFVEDFLRQIANRNEYNTLFTDKGGLSDVGEARIANALFASAYGDLSLLRKATNSGDDDARAMTAGMIDATGAVQELRRNVQAGMIRPEFDIVPSIVQVADRLRAAKANGLTPGDIVSTEDMINPMSDLEKSLIRLFSNEEMTRIASKSAIGKRLKAYVEAVQDQSPAQDLVGGQRRISPQEGVRAALNPGQAALFSARRAGQDQAGVQAEGIQGQESAATEKAQALIKGFLDDLRAKGKQGRLLANGLEDALKNRKFNSEQVYEAFMVNEALLRTLPPNANYRFRFLEDIVIQAEEAGAASASGAKAGQRAQARIIKPTESLPGFIEISLAEDMLPLLRETAAHEAFHVLQDYFGAYDPAFAKLISKSFKENMTLDELDPSIKRRLQIMKPPGSDQTYWQALQDDLGDAPLSINEAQAYAFGSLIDAANRGQKIVGLTAPFQRFVAFARNMLGSLGSGLRGDGFTNAADLLLEAQARGSQRQEAAPVGEGSQFSGRDKLIPQVQLQYQRGVINAKERNVVLDALGGARYQVIDARTGSVVGEYSNKARAQNEADKRDAAYGAVRYRVKLAPQNAESSTRLSARNVSANRMAARKPAASKPASPKPSAPPGSGQAFHNMVVGSLNKPSVFDSALAKLIDKRPGESAGAAIARTAVNRAAPLWNLDQMVKGQGYTGRSAAQAMEMALSNTGRIGQMLSMGMARIDPKTGEISPRDDVKPLLSIMRDNGVTADNKQEFQSYIVALREKDLRRNGKQGFIQATDQMVASRIRDAEKSHPEWKKAAAELDKFNDSLIDWAFDTGLIGKAQADALRDVFYTPFYRIMDKDNLAEPSRSVSPKMGDSFKNVASALNKELGGGTKPLGDVFENIIRNADSIMKAGLKNLAMQTAAETMQFAKLGQINPTTKSNENTIIYKVAGKEVRFDVEDPALFSALIGMPREMQRGIYDTMARVAGFFRDMVTVAPSFMFGNLYKGKISAYVQEGQPFMTNTLAGVRDALNASTSLQNFQWQTGFGGMEYGMGDRNMARVFDQKLSDKGIMAALKKGNAWAAMRQAYGKMQELSEATEMAERIKMAERLIKEGVPPRDAYFQGYLLAPYSRRGTGEGWVGYSLQYLMPLVPFLNAKVQTTYRLIENEKGDKRKIWTLGLPQQIFLRGLVVTAFSLLAYAANLADDEERWDEIPPYMKLNYDIIPVGGNYITLPRAFEIGNVFGALPIFILDAVRRGESRDLAKALTEVGLRTFWMNPTPKALDPILSVFANYDFFRDRPLESLADQGLPVQERTSRTTTQTGQALSSVVNTIFGDRLSPIKAQALLDGYTGTLGVSLMSGFDSLLAASGAIPGKPAGAFGDPASMPGMLANAVGMGRFYREDAQMTSRFVGDFYQIKQMTDQLVRSQNTARQAGDVERLSELQGEAGLPLQLRSVVNSSSERISDLNRRIRMIERSNVDAVEKAERIQPLIRMRDQAARRVVDRARDLGVF